MDTQSLSVGLLLACASCVAPDQESLRGLLLPCNADSWQFKYDWVVGTIVPYTQSFEDVPSGWLSCNGQEVRKGDYPELSKILNPTGADVFRLPNYDGMSLGGLGGPRILRLQRQDAKGDEMQEEVVWLVRAL